jgi:hypothetical protein
MTRIDVDCFTICGNQSNKHISSLVLLDFCERNGPMPVRVDTVYGTRLSVNDRAIIIERCWAVDDNLIVIWKISQDFFQLTDSQAFPIVAPQILIPMLIHV